MEVNDSVTTDAPEYAPFYSRVAVSFVRALSCSLSNMSVHISLPNFKLSYLELAMRPVGQPFGLLHASIFFVRLLAMRCPLYCLCTTCVSAGLKVCRCLYLPIA